MALEHTPNQSLERVKLLNPHQLVMEAISIRSFMVRSETVELLYPSSNAILKPSEVTAGTYEMTINQGQFTYTVVEDHTGSSLPQRIMVHGPDGLISPNMFQDLASFKPDTGIAPGGIKAGDVFEGLRRFILNYTAGSPVDPETINPANPSEWGNFVRFLLQSGRLPLQDLEGFLETYRTREYTVTPRMQPGVISQSPNLPLDPSPSRGTAIRPPGIINRPEDPRKEAVRSAKTDKPLGALASSGNRDIASERVITPANVPEVVGLLKTEPPMTKPTDALLRKFFVFVTRQLEKTILPYEFPFHFYDGDVRSPEELQLKYREMIRTIKEVIDARGRNHPGPIGSWFWSTSGVADLEEVFAKMGEMIRRIDPMLGN